jgi:hypothetical protein
MRNPLRTEAEAFRFLLVTIAGAIVIVGCAYANTWLGVAAAVLVLGAIVWWLRGGPSADAPRTPARPAGNYRILVVAPAETVCEDLREKLKARVEDRDAEVLVVVPGLAPAQGSARAAEQFASQLSGGGLRARGAAGADDPVRAAEDALREFGADEVVLADADESLRSRAQDRLSVPVSLLS